MTLRGNIVIAACGNGLKGRAFVAAKEESARQRRRTACIRASPVRARIRSDEDIRRGGVLVVALSCHASGPVQVLAGRLTSSLREEGCMDA